MPSLATLQAQERKSRAQSALSSKARKRQLRVVLLCFLAFGVAFVSILAGLESARAGAANGSGQANAPKNPGQRVAQAPLGCMLAPNAEPGMLSITIDNDSEQVINRAREIFYQLVSGRDQPLHKVRAPLLIPTGESFTVMVPTETDLRPGRCVAWIFVPTAP
jgi:hypothetical protein